MNIQINDMAARLKMMDNYKEYDTMLIGENHDGEMVCVSVFKDKVVVKTIQKNDWIRVNVFYRDGTTDELYEK